MKRRLIVHPVLFAILPILLLYSHNIGELSLGELLIPTVVAAVASLLLWVLLGRILRDGVQAGLVVSFFWVWFFSYGHILALIKKVPAIGMLIPERYTFTTLYCVLLFACVVVLIRYGQKWRTASPVLNMVAVTLVAWHVVTTGHYEVKRFLAYRHVSRMGRATSVEGGRVGRPPNIYFIVLDGYARADVLRDVYNHDNSDFLGYLERKGFFVARQARANYCETQLSIVSCLNLDYVDHLAKELGYESGQELPLAMMVASSKAGEFLAKRGYRAVAFASGYGPTDLWTADLYLGQLHGLGLFQSALLNTTPLPSAFVSRTLFGLDEADMHRRKVLYAFEHLPDTAKLQPPVFVFAHIISPHPPFLFDRDGQPVDLTGAFELFDGKVYGGTREAYVRGYRDQLIFVNRQIQATLDRLLASAIYPTVIILLADHGPRSGLISHSVVEEWELRERFGILTALYLPGDPEMVLTDEMSHVNVFRVVLNRYFGASLPLLPNESYESYYSDASERYGFARVTDAVKWNDSKDSGPP